jgi:hypothetical protein
VSAGQTIRSRDALAVCAQRVVLVERHDLVCVVYGDRVLDVAGAFGGWRTRSWTACARQQRLFRVAVGCLGEYDWHLRAMLLCVIARQEI